jgi:F-type H+-transporting ATPase subunit alpha
MEIRAEEISQIIRNQIKDYEKKVEMSETGTVLSVGDGIARVYGIEKAMAMEMVELTGGVYGLCLNLEERGGRRQEDRQDRAGSRWRCRVGKGY